MEIFLKLDIFLKEKIFQYYYYNKYRKIIKNAFGTLLPETVFSISCFSCRFCGCVVYWDRDDRYYCPKYLRRTEASPPHIHVCANHHKRRWVILLLHYRKPPKVSKIKF